MNMFHCFLTFIKCQVNQVIKRRAVICCDTRVFEALKQSVICVELYSFLFAMIWEDYQRRHLGSLKEVLKNHLEAERGGRIVPELFCKSLKLVSSLVEK